MKITRLLILLGCISLHAQDNYNLIIGTYTNACESEGIYVYDFNTKTGEATLKNSSEGVINPSYVTVSADNKFLYSVNENGEESTVSAFNYTASSGKIEFINKKDSKGADPCYIINDDKHVIVANYTGGTIAVFAKDKHGGLTKAKQVVKHSGSSINKDRQEGPHVHMVYFSPDKNYIFANDLGTDKISVYKYNKNATDGSKVLTLADTVEVKKGSGPRHLVFSPNNVFFYVLQELDGTLTAFSYVKGKIEKIQESTIVTPYFTGQTGAADIHISHDGKFLYATNRGDANTISVFRVHANGKINLVQQLTTEGIGPRNFAFGPKEDYLLVANQISNDVIIFKRDRTTGMLTDTEKCIELCSPVCLVFTAVK
ncbi:lactonase family protein [Flavobacterium beibuense]|uniref:lactonase family protein n=1 Tax=Flavobacterium beibuense TaxID=657326 RepID=UPI003A8F6CBF